MLAGVIGFALVVPHDYSSSTVFSEANSPEFLDFVEPGTESLLSAVR